MMHTSNFPAFVDNPETIEFVGHNHLSYRESWLRAYHKTQNTDKVKSSLSLNFGALLLFPFWCGYRKLYWPLILFIGFFCATILFEIFSGVFVPTIVYFLFVIIMGSRANGLYLHHVTRFFDRLKPDDEEKRIALIQKKGGTSIVGGVLTSIAFLLVLIAVFTFGVALAEAVGLDVSHVYQ